VAFQAGARSSVPESPDPQDEQIARQAKATAQAIEWVSRILAVVAVMILPGLGGRWLDGRFGTNVFTLLGFGLGLVLGIFSLLTVVNTPKPPDQKT
jgi:hypothetical protein